MTPSAPHPSSSTSRRSFLRLAGLAASLPVLSEGHLAWAALQQSTTTPVPHGRMARVQGAIPPGAVMINANENPLGPCAAAIAAIEASAKTGGRYDDKGYAQALTGTFIQQTGLPADHIAVYAGSSEPLQFSVLAFTSPTQSVVIADPTYEAAMWAASSIGTKVVKVPLRADYAHDVKAMAAVDPNAGLLYLCNPNNPTGTLTTREDILWLLANKPKGSILLVDEAYIHLSTSPSVLDMVAQDKDLIVLRTFSKVYGMAGIRCGFALGRPDLLQKLQRFGMNPMPVTALAAATASLTDATLVESRRKIIAGIRNDTFAWLTAKGYNFIPSESNCFMIDTGRPGKDVIAAMQAHNVYIGRTWPVWPNHVRITVGTAEEMAKFQTAFQAVMSQPPSPTAA